MAKNKPTDMSTLLRRDRDALAIVLIGSNNIANCLMILFFVIERTTW